MVKNKPDYETWHVKPDYGKENVFYLWNEDDNYHDDTSPEAMDRRAKLMEAAPVLYKTIRMALRNAREPDATDWILVQLKLEHALRIARQGSGVKP